MGAADVGNNPSPFEGRRDGSSGKQAATRRRRRRLGTEAIGWAVPHGGDPGHGRVASLSGHARAEHPVRTWFRARLLRRQSPVLPRGRAAVASHRQDKR